jgi:membrane protein DedA with SNARE-associated domain
MAHELFNYIAQHGYITIFILVFLVEIGIPNPVPNELILLYAGALAAGGVLKIVPVVILAVTADFIGTSILYYAFYLFGGLLVSQNYRWFPAKKLGAFSQKISRRGRWGIFLGRLVPYVRGYTSVAAGLLRIHPKTFLSVVIFSAMLWSGGYVILGYFVGPHVETFAEKLGVGQTGVIIGLVVCIALFWIVNRIVSKKELSSDSSPEIN